MLRYMLAKDALFEVLDWDRGRRGSVSGVIHQDIVGGAVQMFGDGHQVEDAICDGAGGKA